MLQSWRDLVFMHFPADPDSIQRTLPPGLQVDTWPDADGHPVAWIGLVCFSMENIRYPGLPAMPWLSAFPETNVRTYVHHRGGRPGVWFYSLDAARMIGCEIGRTRFGLNYVHAWMRHERRDLRVETEIRRIEQPHASLELNAVVEGTPQATAPGSFEFWLAERYLLYANLRGSLVEGQVAHKPYELSPARVERLETDLLEANGLRFGPLSHVAYSPGVDVEVFSVRPVA